LESWNQTAQEWSLEGPLFFYADRKSKMAATTGHSINTEPYGENTGIYFSLGSNVKLSPAAAAILNFISE
jgi:hypothetical protein